MKNKDTEEGVEIRNEKEKESEKREEVMGKDGNLILKGDDSLWKNQPTVVTNDEKKMREADFEDYLEELLL